MADTEVATPGRTIHIKFAFTGDACVKKARRIARGRRRKRKEPVEPAEPRDENWFCCLMKQLDGQCKNETSIQVSETPLATVYDHNAGNVDDKSTKAARGHWMPEMIIGPFARLEDAQKFKDGWMDRSRGIISKRRFGIQQTVDWRQTHPNLRCYDKRVVPRDYNEFLGFFDMYELAVSKHLLSVMWHQLREHTAFDARSLARS